MCYRKNIRVIFKSDNLGNNYLASMKYYLGLIFSNDADVQISCLNSLVELESPLHYQEVSALQWSMSKMINEVANYILKFKEVVMLTS